MSTLIYQSSKGPLVIANMAYTHARSAYDKLIRENADLSRVDEIAALGAHLDKLQAEYAKEHPDERPLGDPAPAGDNRPPPEPAPAPTITGYEGFETHINDLLQEANAFLNGDGVKTPGEAEAVKRVSDMLRVASRDADKARAEEKKPYDDGAKAVQTKWTPLIGKASTAIDVCKRALEPYLRALEATRAREAEDARIAAARQAEAARQAIDAANATGNLEAREAAEAAVKDAKAAEKVVGRIEKAPAAVSGGGRAVGLRSYFIPTIVDRRALLMHYLATNPDAITVCLQKLAEDDVRAGKRSIPGCTISEERRVA